MGAVFDPYFDALPSAQRAIWSSLTPVQDLDFALYGGTAIALRLGHRSSVDFDFFSSRPLDREALWQALPFIRDATVLQDQPSTITVLSIPPGQANEGPTVKLSFFGGIRFGRIREPCLTRDGVLQVASFDDLLATKLKVLLQRVEAKDYQDIAALVRSNVDLARGLAGARALYGNSFQPSEALKVLVYFEGGDLDNLSSSDKSTLVDAVSTVREIPEAAVVGYELTRTNVDDGPQPSV